MAYNFVEASQQYLTVATLPLTAVPFTSAAWTRLPVTVPAGGTADAMISFTVSGTVQRNALIHNTVARIAVTYAGESSPAGITSATGTISNNVWAHACGVFTTNASRTVYRDGGNSTTNTTDISPISAFTALSLGARIINVTDQFLNGDIAEAGIWNVALTADEIASLGKSMSPKRIRPQNLVFYAPLIRNLQDYSRASTITNVNGATASDHPRVY